MKTTIPDHYDTLALITDKSNPAHEFEVWQAFARQNPEDWNGDEFTLADFEAYIASQKDCMGHLSGRTETPAPAAPVLRQHTPGPFRAVPSAAHAPGSGSIRVDIVSDGTEFSPSGVACDMLPADAALFCAATDLLDLLQAAVLRVEMANKEGNPILSAWLPDAYAAIAKATGHRSALQDYGPSDLDVANAAVADRDCARMDEENKRLRTALEALLDWGRDYTSPSQDNSPHTLLVAAHEALGRP